MFIEAIETVIYTIQFIIPGYIILQVIRMVAPTKQLSDSEMALQSICYSMLYLCIWWWFIKLIPTYISSTSSLFWLIHLTTLVITGFITGLILGVARKNTWLRKILEKINVNIQHPFPTAWDYKFSDGEAYWLEVIFDDGTCVRGHYDYQSFASSEEIKDIFIEEVYLKNEKTNEWDKLDRTRGVWVNPVKVKSIYFYSNEEDQTDE